MFIIEGLIDVLDYLFGTDSSFMKYLVDTLV